MMQPEHLKYILITGIALTTLSASVANANVYSLDVRNCHFSSVKKCPFPYSGKEYENCYISNYNRCIASRFFLRPRLRR